MLTTVFSAKKTKAELLEEYKKLRNELEEIKTTAKLIHQPQSLEAVSKAKAMAVDTVTQAFQALRQAVGSGVTDFASTVEKSLTAVLNDIVGALKQFDELQQAVALSRQTLEYQYHIQVTAETLDQLVVEYEAKKKQLQDEGAQMRQSIDDEIALKKRDWVREQEEYEYSRQLKHRRDEELSGEERAKREHELAEREIALKAREQEVASMKTQIDAFPARLEHELKEQGEVMRGEVGREWIQKLEASQKDWDSEKRLLGVQITSLEQSLKRQDAEISQLKKETEFAQKKSQELAVKVIESSAPVKVSGGEAPH